MHLCNKFANFHAFRKIILLFLDYFVIIKEENWALLQGYWIFSQHNGDYVFL